MSETKEAYYDAQRFNDSERNSQKYSDIDLFFGKNASNTDINKITDVQAVKRSIRNLVLLNHYEKPFHPEIGSGVRDMLFELMTPVTAQILARKIQDVSEMDIMGLPNALKKDREQEIKRDESLDVDDTEFL